MRECRPTVRAGPCGPPIKAVEELAPIHKAPLISYLKLGGFPAGLLINFNVVHLRDGIKRVYPQAARVEGRMAGVERRRDHKEDRRYRR